MEDQTDPSVRGVRLLRTSLAIVVSIGIYTGAFAGDASDIRPLRSLRRRSVRRVMLLGSGRTQVSPISPTADTSIRRPCLRSCAPRIAT